MIHETVRVFVLHLLAQTLWTLVSPFLTGQNIYITAIVTSVVCGMLLIASLILIVTVVSVCTKKAQMKRGT